MLSPRSTQSNDRELNWGLNEEGYLLQVQETSCDTLSVLTVNIVLLTIAGSRVRTKVTLPSILVLGWAKFFTRPCYDHISRIIGKSVIVLNKKRPFQNIWNLEWLMGRGLLKLQENMSPDDMKSLLHQINDLFPDAKDKLTYL